MTQLTARDRAGLAVVRLLTDLKTWGLVLVFTLCWKIFDLISEKPQLAKDQGFMFLAQAVIVSGLVTAIVGALFNVRRDHDEARPSPPPEPPPATAA